MLQKFLTISIPAYNDSCSLLKLVTETNIICKELDISFDVLIINDGSHDDTLMIARELATEYDNIKIINHEKNLGFGETLKKVFMLPKTEWVLFLPGDNQFPISNLIPLLKIKDQYDYILGYRKFRKDAFHRIAYSKLYNMLVSFISGHKVKDVNSIVFFRSSIFDKIKLSGKTAFVHAEFFIKTSEAGFRTTEAEISHQEREFGFGSGGNPKVVIGTILELLFYFIKK